MFLWATRSNTSVSWSRSTATASLLNTMPPPTTMSMAAKRCSGVQLLSITPVAPAARPVTTSERSQEPFRTIAGWPGLAASRLRMNGAAPSPSIASSTSTRLSG